MSRGAAKGDWIQRAWRRRMVVRERAMRKIKSSARSTRSVIVGGGRVVTTNSAVVGEGRRICSRGAVVSILAALDSGGSLSEGGVQWL